jgi:hypothetical protein
VAQYQPVVRFVTNQPNIIKNYLIKELFVNSNLMNVSSPKKIIRNSPQERKHEKKTKKKLKNYRRN